MSGGHFNYRQSAIWEIAEEIQHLIDTNDVEDDFGYKREFSTEVLAKFHEAVRILRKGYAYAQRIDWLVSCDDGEEMFLRH